MITTFYTLYPLLGPQGSRSVCLGTFSWAVFGWTGWEKQQTTTPNKTLSREWGQWKWTTWKDVTSFKDLVLQTTLWEELPGKSSQGPTEVCAEWVSASAWLSAGGATFLSFQSLANSYSVGHEKWRLHKVERKCIVSITHYILPCSGDNISYPIKRIIYIIDYAEQERYNVSLKELSLHCKKCCLSHSSLTGESVFISKSTQPLNDDLE